jgi:two-component system response regulator AtoC
MVAQSEAMKRLITFARRIAASQASTVLLEGESGTGKEVVARLLHDEGLRRDWSFIPVNCAAVPETLFESELFGHEKGAFTDARCQKKGLLEMADGGTVFLDEIGEVPIRLQVKLLRALEEQSFRRLGGEEEISVDVRVVAATNKDLREAVKTGRFRLDLYYRLNVIQILIPPLRERREDIMPLLHHFLGRYNLKFHRQVEGVHPRTATLLLRYDWPGNVRELRNVVERALILEEATLLQPSSLPEEIQSFHAAGSTPAEDLSDGSSVLEAAERALVQQALEASGGNQARAARLLGIGRTALRRRVKKLGLSGPKA